MYNFSITGITVNSFFDDRRVLANEKYPIRIRVTYKRVRQYFNTGISLSQIDWEKLPNTKNSSLLRNKDIIQMTFNQISKVVEILAKEDVFSIENLNIRLGKGIDSTLNAAYQSKINTLIIDEKHSTSDFYKYSLKAVEGFAGCNLKFSSITVDWLKKFEKHLISKERSYTTISMYMRGLQAVINDGKKMGIIKQHQYPFGVGKYVIPQHEGRNIALTLKDILQLVNYECNSEAEYYYRDLWLFSYLCNGANIADICNLKFENVKRGNIEFYRQKTLAKSKVKKAVVAFITPKMQEIVDQWGNKKTLATDHIFPILKGNESSLEKRAKIKSVTRSINHYMTKIGNKLGIGNISTYTARHSFATVLKRSGTNIAFISESLGHSDLKITETYLASFEDEERQKNALILTDFSNVN
ncbi:MAG: site-specific integrase [Mucilaginibacter sp.]